MRLMPVDPTAIVLVDLYLALAHAGRQYTGYIGGTMFHCGVATEPVAGWQAKQGLLNACHLYPYHSAVRIDWTEQTPRVQTVDPLPAPAAPPEEPVKPVKPEPVTLAEFDKLMDEQRTKPPQTPSLGGFRGKRGRDR